MEKVNKTLEDICYNPDHVKDLVGEIRTPDNVFRPAHYTKWRVEPFTFLMLNNVPFAEGAVIKYVMRWRTKNGIEDLKKARRILEMMIELEEHTSDYLAKKTSL